MSHSLLIVDDSATTRAFIRRIVGVCDLPVSTIHEAGDGQAALQLLRTQPIGLVLADLQMPGMSGVELVAQMRSEAALRTIPVLIVSADPNTARLEDLVQGGALGYVRKPFTPEMLSAAIQNVLGGTCD